MDLDEITVPVYIAAHKNDNCEATPSSDTPIIKEMLTSAKNVKVEIFLVILLILLRHGYQKMI